MDILEKALKMLESHPLCDRCLGRQFAFLGLGMENDERGKAIKNVLLMEAQARARTNKDVGVRILRILAANGFCEKALETLRKMKKYISKWKAAKNCFLCGNKFKIIDDLANKAVEKLKEYEYSNFLIGIELPVEVEEREDEFKARFNVEYGENMRLEFGRILGKKIAVQTQKAVEYRKPDVVVIINPMTGEMRVQVNPLYIAGRYRKLVRGIPQSRWLCTSCRGYGCENCNWTGKRYQESVEELVSSHILKVTGGTKAMFHGSGREDVDTLMLGKGRPFVIEIAQPKRRFLDLKRIEEEVNTYANGKVEVLNLRLVDKEFVRKLKKSESAIKEYRVIVEFEKEIADTDLKLIEGKLIGAVVRQRTPTRVLHRHADLTREKYIYEVKVKKLSTKEAELKVRCQGGLYVKELVTGDDGRTTPSVSEILGKKTKPIKLDVLKVFMRE